MTGRISVPASLLLAGEYFILLEGGLGLAAAVELRASAEFRTTGHGGVKLRGIFGGREESWDEPREGSGRGTGLIPGVFCYLRTLMPDGILPPLEITIDTSPFFDQTGGKLGFGSSAAVTLLITAAVLCARASTLLPADELLLPAIMAHRAAQGGHGSGYDIAVSLFGGLGLFAGGITPAWCSYETSDIDALSVRSSRNRVETTAAITRFEEYRHRNPADIDELFKTSNSLLNRSDEIKGFNRILELLTESRRIGIELGRLIGVNADLAAALFDPALSSGFWKAAGAGDELAFQPRRNLDHDALPLSREGLRYE